MKWVPKQNEGFYMLQVIRTRYGRTDVRSKNERALLSLPCVAKILDLPFKEFRRLYRKFFKHQQEETLTAEHLRFITNQERLQEQATYTLRESCDEFSVAF